MRNIGDPRVLQSLLARLRAVDAQSQRRWGTLTPHEMLCHLGDATAMVLGVRPRPQPVPLRRRPLVKWLGLWSPVPWPHGWPSSPMLDPKAGGTRPSAFAQDLARAIDGLERLAVARADTVDPAHGFFGTMSVLDWQRWAYRHTHHHLRQFGL